jgi:hypothetical protein
MVSEQNPATEIEQADSTRVLEQGLTALTGEVRKLVAAQSRTEEWVGQLATVMKGLAIAQTHTEQQMQKLAVALERTHSLASDFAEWGLEWRHQHRPGAYFGALLRRLRVLSLYELEDELEARLPAAEFEDLLQVDLLLSGQPRSRPEVPEVWLVVEVSAIVDRYDVERAQRRAAALQQAGYRAIPTVSGERITAMAQEAALDGNVLVIQEGEPLYWKGALKAALAD